MNITYISDGDHILINEIAIGIFHFSVINDLNNHFLEKFRFIFTFIEVMSFIKKSIFF